MNRIKTHCKHGHPLSGDNVVFDSWGRHQCVTCRGEKTPEEKRTAKRKYDNARRAKRTSEKIESERLAAQGRSAKFRDNNRERLREYQRLWQRAARLKNPERLRMRGRKTNIKRSYGITAEEYEAKLAAQNNLCALCGKSFDLTNEMTRPHLDHNHVTDKLRDFIHGRCNLGIGHFHDDPAMCRKAEEYLLRHPEET
jgi:hypothetical protein